MAPEVLRRENDGTVIARAVRLTRPLDFDGRLDDEVYLTTAAMDGFIQQEPTEGAPTTEKTEAWVFFDDHNLYVSARCWDSHPERMVITEMRRDNGNITQNESFVVTLDTFLDHRNGFFFQTSPLGAIRDQAIVDDVLNPSWNTVWDARAARFDQGWTLEMTIPFKSLRYATAGPQVWGMNFRRIIKWKNEFAYLVSVPASLGTQGAIGRMGWAATLVGVETPSQSMNLELKPYAVASSVTDNTVAKPITNDFQKSGGFDFKYGLTRGLISDVTVNTDFSQVEEDVQQVNFTRFSLFFPEKRDFFLEGLGNFAFGGVGAGTGSPGDVPQIFFSRRIGLSGSQEVPVLGGGRVTGRSGLYSIGALNIETGDKESAGAQATNFSVLRVKRDILRRSNFGMIATRRSRLANSAGTNSVLGADANLYLFTNVTVSGFYAFSDTTGVSGSTNTYRGTVDYNGDRYGFSGEHMLIGGGFDAQTGYVRRTDVRRTAGSAQFTPRPRRRTVIRKYTYSWSGEYVTDAPGVVVQNHSMNGQFIIDLQNSDQFSASVGHNYELIPKAFTVSGVSVPAAGYTTDAVTVAYTLGQNRKLSGKVSGGYSTYYDGTRSQASYSGRVGIVRQFAFEPSVTLNWGDLPLGHFSSTLVSSRFILTPTPRLMVTSLVQFNATGHTLSSSIRMRWEYMPGSEIFLVYGDGRDTLGVVQNSLLNRSLAFKITKLLRF